MSLEALLNPVFLQVKTHRGSPRPFNKGASMSLDALLDPLFLQVKTHRGSSRPFNNGGDGCIIYFTSERGCAGDQRHPRCGGSLSWDAATLTFSWYLCDTFPHDSIPHWLLHPHKKRLKRILSSNLSPTESVRLRWCSTFGHTDTQLVHCRPSSGRLR